MKPFYITTPIYYINARPHIGQRRSDQLTEHLVNFGCSGQIAGGAQRVAGCVIIGVAGLHIGLNGQWPFLADALDKRAPQRGFRQR